MVIMPLKQVHMSIYDINPTESFWDKVDDRQLYKEDAQLWLKQELIDDIRENGVKYQLNVDRFGNIQNGNMRYWCCRYLLEVEGDLRFLFLPVQRNYVAGAFYEEFNFVVKQPPNGPKVTQKEVDDIGGKLTVDIHSRWVNQTRELTLPHKEAFDVFEVDPIDEFRMTNFWDQQRTCWSVFLQPHPQHKKRMICFGIAGDPGQVPILAEGSEKEKKAYKEWWMKVRKERKITGSAASLENIDYRKAMHGKLKSQ